MPKRTTASRAAAAALAIALSAGLSAGTLVLAVPASAAVAQTPSVDPGARRAVTNVFNEMNAFRAAKGLAPVRLGLDASAVLQDYIDHPSADPNGPDSIVDNKRLKGYSNCGMTYSRLEDRSSWTNNPLLTQAGTVVVGLVMSGSDMVTTAYLYKALPGETFATAADYFAYLDLPQLQGQGPKLLGTPAWGSTLTVSAGTWPPGTKLSYQWFQTNGGGYTYPVEGSSNFYLVSDTDMDRKLSVRLTAALPGRQDAVLFSETTPLIQRPATVANIKAPAIIGALEAGQKLTASPGTWDGGTTFTYRWLGPDGRPIDGATSSTYTPAHEAQLSVEVTGSKAGLRSTRVTSSVITVIDINTKGPAQSFGDNRKPREGAPAVGEEFYELGSGQWMDGTVLTRQWTRDGKSIAGATGTSYTVTAADVGTRIALSLTGTRRGNKPRTVSAEPSEKIVALRPPVLNTKAPSIVGSGIVGKPLTVVDGTWTAGTRLTYQWRVRRDSSHGVGWDTPIPGATSKAYTPTAADDGGIITVVVTGWKDGYVPLEVGNFGWKNPQVEVHKALVVTPRISSGVGFDTDSGSVYQGDVLTANVWKSGAALTFQWKRNGVVIPGATGQTYKTGNGDAGKKITVTVTGKLAGSPTATVTSAATSPIVQYKTQYFQVPSYSWANGKTPVVGQIMSVLTPGKWTPGAKITYQWKRNGSAIKEATGSTYKVVSADVGKLITVDVTGQVSDYLPATAGSMPTPVRAKP